MLRELPLQAPLPVPQPRGEGAREGPGEDSPVGEGGVPQTLSSSLNSTLPLPCRDLGP